MFVFTIVLGRIILFHLVLLVKKEILVDNVVSDFWFRFFWSKSTNKDIFH
jgi:hypothetical protein